MIKYLLNKTSFIIKYILFLLLLFIIIESISRGFIWIVTKDLKTFSYGFNKDIKIDIFHLRKLNIKLTDLYLVNQSTLKNKSKYKDTINKDTIIGENIRIWTFGGSTTEGNICGRNSSSWQAELIKINNNIGIYNFGESATDSSHSLYKLRQSILIKKVPKIVIWAHKFNEINVIYQGLRANKHVIVHDFPDMYQKKLMLQIDATFKNNFLSYKILENFILSVSRKIIMYLGKEHINKNLNDKDFEYASINYKINTMKAIKLSKENGIEKFILLSLPATTEYEKKMKNFFIYYYQRVEEFIKDDYVDFIDLSKHSIIKIDNKNLFCDEIHKTLQGNIIVAEILNEYLKIKGIIK